MRKISLRFVVLAAGTLLIWFACSSVFAADISEAMRKEDPRLEKRVTVFSGRVYVGELLETLSAQTGIAVTADDQTSAGDDPVAVYVRDVPVAQVMNAVYSLVSYKRATWHWRRSGEPGRFRYDLVRPRAAQLFSFQMRETVQQDFEAESDRMEATLHMTPEQIKEAAESDQSIAALQTNERRKSGLNTFFERFSREARLRILRGQDTPTLRVDQLSEEGRTLVRSIWEQSKSKSPQPTSVVFSTLRLANDLTPNLFIFMEGVGGYNYLGGPIFEKKWRDKLTDLWLLAGDKTDDPAAAREATQPRNTKPEPRTRYMLAYRLGQLAESAPLSLLARLPAAQYRDPGSPYGQSAEAFLKRLGKGYQGDVHVLQHKWRDGVLLLSRPAWLVEEEQKNRVPWRLVKRLREVEQADPDGFLTLQNLASAAGQLKIPQLERLGREDLPVMTQIADWRNLFAQINRSPQLVERLRSPAGVPLVELISFLRSPEYLGVEKLTASQSAGAAVRIREGLDMQQKPPARTIDFLIHSRDGTFLTGGGFSYQPNQFRRSSDPPASTNNYPPSR